MKLEKFPFDVQHCSATIEACKSHQPRTPKKHITVANAGKTLWLVVRYHPVLSAIPGKLAAFCKSWRAELDFFGISQIRVAWRKGGSSVLTLMQKRNRSVGDRGR